MRLGIDLLWLSESDVADILSMKEAIAAVESSFVLKSEGKVQMPSKVYLDFNPFPGDLRTMPAYLRGDHPFAGVKIVNSNAKNPSEGLPAVSGIMVVNDPKTGLPLAVMAAGNLTSLRTGAAGGVAAKYLAKSHSSIVGLIGCGRQAMTQLDALSHLFSLKKILVWGKTQEEADDFLKKAQKRFPLPFVLCQNGKEACQADIVVTTTPVRNPIVQNDWIVSGTHINAIGADAPGKQELSMDLLKRAKVYVDEWTQASHGGEINRAVSEKKMTKADLAGELGDVITSHAPGRHSDEEITIFDSTGLAIQDVSVGQIVFEKAKKFNKGQVLKING